MAKFKVGDRIKLDRNAPEYVIMEVFNLISINDKGNRAVYRLKHEHGTITYPYLYYENETHLIFIPKFKIGDKVTEKANIVIRDMDVFTVNYLPSLRDEAYRLTRFSGAHTYFLEEDLVGVHQGWIKDE